MVNANAMQKSHEEEMHLKRKWAEPGYHALLLIRNLCATNDEFCIKQKFK